MTLKTCATCRWMIDPGVYAKCNAPQNVSPVSALTGFPEAIALHCSTMRGRLSSGCGPEGLWWAEREAAVEDPS